MKSNYITIKKDEIDFSPLWEKQDTIFSFHKVQDREKEGIRFVQYHINRQYSPKIKILKDCYIGSCNCLDFILTKLPDYQKDNSKAKFCKHLLTVLEELEREKRD